MGTAPTTGPEYVPLGQRRLEEWHDNTHVMHSANASAATQNEVLSRALGAFVAVATAFAGSTLFATLEGSTSESLQLTAAVLASLGAIVSAVQTALAPGTRATKYHNAAVRYGALRRRMEEWRMENPTASRPSNSTLALWSREWRKAEAEAPRLRQGRIEKARRRVAEQKALAGEAWFPTAVRLEEPPAPTEIIREREPVAPSA